MADDKEKFMTKEDFIRALGAMMQIDPQWGITEAIAILGRAQQGYAEAKARDSRYDEIRKAG